MAPNALILDLVAWVAPAPKPYAEVIDAWRTNCPRLTVWEDALDAGLVALRPNGAGGLVVTATEAGRAALARATDRVG
ncbi:hypothetical protein ACQW02_11565 [Humitalea sp. 24SJ18S-53]|uniref:hypothetical protein n=1 Tax=Humitalea sp. 24SJ18S-53 TaxID=3422307 RepID=UPI003D66CDB9